MILEYFLHLDMTAENIFLRELSLNCNWKNLYIILHYLKISMFFWDLSFWSYLKNFSIIKITSYILNYLVVLKNTYFQSKCVIYILCFKAHIDITVKDKTRDSMHSSLFKQTWLVFWLSKARSIILEGRQPPNIIR